MKICTGYVRRSEESTENTVSLPDQSRHIEDYCARKGLALAAVVFHDGVSGGERSRWEDLSSVLKATGSEAVVFAYQDRMARDTQSLLNNFEQYAHLGIEIHEATQGLIDPKDPTQKLMLTVRAAMDENYKNCSCSRLTIGC